jgi:hypothetical protein
MTVTTAAASGNATRVLGGLPRAAECLLNSCGAGQAPHSGRTLLDHLVGTYQLLANWGCPPHVCLAGLFHSIYGTNAFHRRSLGIADRDRLRDAIGTQAEALAWAFCGIDRPRAILRALQRGKPGNVLDISHRLKPGGGVLLAPQQVCELAELECANLIEQGEGAPALRDLYCVALSHPGVLRAETVAALCQHLSDGLATRARAQGAKAVSQ